jgi:hypothetical protein
MTKPNPRRDHPNSEKPAVQRQEKLGPQAAKASGTASVTDPPIPRQPPDRPQPPPKPENVPPRPGGTPEEPFAPIPPAPQPMPPEPPAPPTWGEGNWFSAC